MSDEAAAARDPTAPIREVVDRETRAWDTKMTDGWKLIMHTGVLQY